MGGCCTLKNLLIYYLCHLSPVWKLSLFIRQVGIFKVKNCKCFFKTYAKGCILFLPLPVSLELLPFAQPEFSQQPLLVLEGEGGGRMLNRLVPNELWRQLQLGQILLLPPPTLWSCRAVVGAHLPSQCWFADFSAMWATPPPSQSFLAKFRFLCSQLNAHSEKEIQKGRRESEGGHGGGGDF